MGLSRQVDGAKRRASAALLAVMSVLGLAAPALAQFEPRGENPVFADESPATAGSLSRVREFLAARNDEQAVRLLQKLLDEHGDEVVVSRTDEALLEPVRLRVHALIRAAPDLLAKYREMMDAGAAEMLRAGRISDVERTRFMTGAGVDATLALARQRLLAGQVDAAALTIAELADHPDGARRAEEIAAAARSMGPYVRNESTRALLAGLIEGEPPAPAADSPAAVGAAPSFNGSAPPLTIDGLVSRPLGTSAFGDDKAPLRPLRWSGPESALEQVPRFGREMRVWPAVTGRAVIVAQGQTVAAFDRITLRELWRHDVLSETGRPQREEGDRLIGGLRPVAPSTWEEVSQPAVAGNTALVVVSIDTEGIANGEGEEYLASFDIESGAIRWVRRIGDLDPQLMRAYVRGPIVTEGPVAVLSLLKRQPERRLLAAILVGIDAYSGEHRWTRLVGSAGALPFYGTSRGVDMAVGHEGIVYRSDRLGVVGAYRIADGRPQWVRRLGSKVLTETLQPLEPWLVNAPVPTERGVFLLVPDREEVMQLDRRSGALLATRPWGELREPQYLLRVGEHLAAVSEIQVATLPLDGFAKDQVKASGRFGAVALGIRGRVTTAGDKLLVPTAAGVTIIDPADPGRMDRAVALDAAGAVLSLPEGLLVADDSRLHMYSTWAIASAHLKAQIASTPTDPGPAAELLALADRAEQTAEVLPAADAAAAAFEKAEAVGLRSDQLERQRSRVIETLLGTVERSIAPAGEGGGAILDSGGVDQALQRATRLARSAKERAAGNLVQGEVLEKRGQTSAAAAIYHNVLNDAELAAAPFAGESGGLRADAEALDRLRRMIRAGNRAAYAEFDAAFERTLAELPPAAGPDAMTEITRRYPLARKGPEAWLRIAGAFGAAGSPKEQMLALDMGVQAAERIGDAPLEAVAALNGELVESLLARDLIGAAADALTRAKSRFPGIVPSAGGKPLDVAALEKSLADKLAATRRWPRVGAPVGDPKPQILDGWALMEPLIPSGTGVAPRFLVLQKADDRRAQVALFGLPTGALVGEAVSAPGAPVQEMWASEKVVEPWQLLRLDLRGATFVVGESEGAVLVRVDAESGKQLWKTEPFGRLFPNDPPLRFGRGVPNDRLMVADGVHSMNELLIATDDRTLTMLERSGRCATLDAETGQTLWTGRLPLTRIVDADVVGGRLIAAGEYPQPQADGKLDRVAVMDARTGAAVSITPSPVQAVRWVRVTTRGDLVIAGRGSIVSVASPDLESGKPAWSVTGHEAVDNVDAWMVEDRLFVMNENRALWEINTASGLAPKVPLETQGRLETRAGIVAVGAGGGRVAFGSSRGVALFSADGALAGVDAVHSGDNAATPSPVDGGFVLVTPAQAPQGVGAEPGATAFVIHRVDTMSAALQSSTPIVLGAPPQRVAAIDGRIAVTAGFSTVVYAAPVK